MRGVHIFGHDAFVNVRHEFRNKLDAKSVKGIFFRYDEEGEKSYRTP